MVLFRNILNVGGTDEGEVNFREIFKAKHSEFNGVLDEKS